MAETTTKTPTAAGSEDLARLRARLRRQEARAAVLTQHRAARQARRQRERLEAIRRRAVLAGESARMRHEVQQSGEARALRLERTRTVALAVLVPVLVAFGGWSAAGVQAGMVALLSLEPDSPAAMAAWLVEPALLGIVAGCILIQARLVSVGGSLDDRASRIEFAALATSIVLNAAGHWPDELGAAGLAALAGHSLGPIGAAGTAYLISVISDAVAEADPWTVDGKPAPSLTVSAGTADAEEDQEEPADPEAAPRPSGWVSAPAGAALLPLVARPAPTEPTERTDRSHGAEELPQRVRRDPLGREIDAGLAALDVYLSAAAHTDAPTEPTERAERSHAEPAPGAEDAETAFEQDSPSERRVSGARSRGEDTEDGDADQRLLTAQERRRLEGERNRARVAEFLQSRPSARTSDIAAELELGESTVRRIRREIEGGTA